MRVNDVQATKNKGIIAAQAALLRARVREQVIFDRHRNERIQAISRRHGIGLNDVLEMVEEDAAARVRRAYEQGFRDGGIAARFSPLPSAQMPRRVM